MLNTWHMYTQNYSTFKKKKYDKQNIVINKKKIFEYKMHK